MSHFKNFCAFVAIYFFIFSPRLAVGGGLNTGLLVVAGLFLIAATVHRRLSFPKSVLTISGVWAFLAVYSTLLAEYYGNNPSYFLNISMAVIISILFSWFFAEILSANGVPDDSLIETLMMLSVAVIFVNSTIIVSEFFAPDFKSALESIQFQDPGANINYFEHAFRFRGLASGGGAGLSILNALGVLLIIFLVIWRRLPGFVGLLAALVIVASNVFTGRTGLIFGILFLIILQTMILSRSMLTGVRGVIGGLLLIFAFVIIVQLVMNIDLDTEVSGWAFEWVDGLMSGKVDSASSDDLESMLFLPDQVQHLFFGIGFFEGDGRLYPRSDSGYVKTILSIGILFGGVLYGMIGWMFAQLRKVDRRYTLMVVAVLGYMYFVEINVRIDDFCVLSAGEGGIVLGDYIHIAVYSSLIGAGKISLADFCNISSRVAIYSSSDDYSGEWMTNPMVPSRFTNVAKADVQLGKHVIVGSGTVVLPGVCIEDGVSVGALSLVNKRCDAFGIYAGVPARRIKERSQNLLDLERQLRSEAGK